MKKEAIHPALLGAGIGTTIGAGTGYLKADEDKSKLKAILKGMVYGGSGGAAGGAGIGLIGRLGGRAAGEVAGAAGSVLPGFAVRSLHGPEAQRQYMQKVITGVGAEGARRGSNVGGIAGGVGGGLIGTTFHKESCATFLIKKALSPLVT